MSRHQAFFSPKKGRTILHDERGDLVDRGGSQSSQKLTAQEPRRAHELQSISLAVRSEHPAGDNNNELCVPGSELPGTMDTHRLIAHYRTGDRKMAPRQNLFTIGQTSQSTYNLLSGWVAIYTLLEDGRRQIVQFALPGAVMGTATSKGAGTSYGAQTLTEAVVSVIPNTLVAAALGDDPELAMRLVSTLARDTRIAYDHMTSIGRRTARERVAHLLLELFTRYRAQWPDYRGEEMELPLTQEQIGDATGLTAVHVNRVLTALRREKIVDLRYRRLRILNPDRLVEVAAIDSLTAMSWFKQQ